MTDIVVTAPSGRMGSAIVRELVQSGEDTLMAALCRPGSSQIDKVMASLSKFEKSEISVVGTLEDTEFEVMIDFSVPAALERHLELCREKRAAIVVGTTGLDEKQNNALSEASREIPVLYAANTSVGINLCVALVDMATRVLGEQVDIEVVEAHHRHKVDAPSGTALLLGETAAAARETSLDECGVFSREGYTGEREDGSIGFSVVRGGNIAGEHSVMFIGDNERIEITHRATDRRIFAQGAIRAARWLAESDSGLYGMQDVLDLH